MANTTSGTTVFDKNFAIDEIIEEAEATIDDEKDWSERVKDQWTEGKAQREARREARQQRRAERQAEDD